MKGEIRLMTKKDLATVFKLFNVQMEKYKFRYKLN